MLKSLAATTAVLLFFTGAIFTPAQAKVSILIVYDGSGSMWAKLGNKERFLVMNKALGEFMDKLPEEVELGLRVYGAARKEDCTDTRLLVPVGAGNRAKIKAEIAKIKPLGKTPIQASLLAAAEDLAEQEGERQILLVSDGKETCSGDPCETARALAEKEKIKISVLAVGVDDKLSKRQLACIASASSGDYFEATNEKQASDSLSQARTKVSALKQEAQVTIRAERPKGILAPTLGMRTEIYDVSKKTAIDFFEGQNPVTLNLPPGVYRARVQLLEEEKSIEEIELETAGKKEVAVEFEALEGLVTVIAKSGAESLGTRVSCGAISRMDPAAGVIAEQYSTLPMILPEGDYDLQCKLLGSSVPVEKTIKNVTIRANQSQQLQLNLPLGSLTVKAIGPPNVLGPRQIYSVYALGDQINRLAWTYCGSAVEVAAGTYDIHVEVGHRNDPHSLWLPNIRVPESTPTEVEADFRPGELLVQVSSGNLTIGNDAKFTAYPPGLEHTKPINWSYNGVPLQLPAGSYDVLVEFSPPQSAAQKQWLLNVIVPSGQRLSHQIEFATGSVQTRVLFGGEDLMREGGFSVYFPGEEKAIGTYENHALAIVPTGTYDIKAESYYHRHFEWRRGVKVIKDKTTTLSVDFTSGKLQIHVMEADQDLGKNATYYVYPQNEKFKYVAFAFSGQPLEVVPGLYDIKVSIGPTTIWKKGVFVEAGETTIDQIDF